MKAFIVGVIFAFAAHSAVADEQEEFVKQLARDLSELSKIVKEAELQIAQREASVGDQVSRKAIVTAESAKLRAGAHETAKVVQTLKPGARYSVVDKVGNWYALGPDLFPPVLGNPPVQAAQYWEPGWVSARDVTVVPVQTQTAPNTLDAIYDKLSRAAITMRDRYKSNPYVFIRGFDVEVVPPGLSISFEFKE